MLILLMKTDLTLLSYMDEISSRSSKDIRGGKQKIQQKMDQGFLKTG
jgi:hypothetical protein